MDAVAQALADPIRREILVMLHEAPRTAGSIADAFPVSRPCISRRLRVLREARLVQRTVAGRKREYSLAVDTLAPPRGVSGPTPGTELLEPPARCARDRSSPRSAEAKRTRARHRPPDTDHNQEKEISMTPKPTGRLRDNDLVLRRTFRAPIQDVWTSVTSSESTARWYGPWESTAENKKIRIQMAFEDGKPWLEGTIEECDAPHRLAVRTKSAYGEKLLSMELSEADGTTTLEFVHHQVKRKAIGELGPGWEYYLDMLVAARDGTSRPKFDAYYPAQKQHYTELDV